MLLYKALILCCHFDAHEVVGAMVRREIIAIMHYRLIFQTLKISPHAFAPCPSMFVRNDSAIDFLPNKKAS
jgi:hypothetical protein